MTTVTPPRVPITVPSSRVPMTVAPPRDIEPRVPVISQEDNIEDIIKMDTVESKNIATAEPSLLNQNNTTVTGYESGIPYINIIIQ